MFLSKRDIIIRRLNECGLMVINGDFPMNDHHGYIHVTNHKFYKRLSYHGVRGLIDSYIQGEWNTDDFKMLFEGFDSLHTANYPNNNGILGEKLSKFILSYSKETRPVVDLSTEFYAKFLDDRMTYSCGKWENQFDTLEQAQDRKYFNICNKANLNLGESILDIGCGWGGFMGYATDNFGVVATGVTLLREEVKYIESKYPNKPIIPIQSDFFEHKGEYDKIIAIGIFEYMTKKRFKKFFEKVRSMLKPNGIFVMQTVLRNGKGRNWILEGMDYLDSFMDSVGEFGCMEDIAEAYSDVFILEHSEVMAGHYPPTLYEWRKRILQDPSIPEPQKRLWEIYLSFCITAFGMRYLDPYQFVFTAKSDKTPNYGKMEFKK